MKTIVWQMCWKYLLIFTMPVLAVVCLFLYNNAHVYRATVSDLQLSVLSQMSGEIDVMINGLNSLSTQMAEREDIVNIQRLSDEEKCDILRMYEGGLPDGVSLLYYFRRTNNIYFQDSILTYHEFEQSSYFDVSLNFMGFFTQLNRCSYSNFIPVDAKAKRGEVYSAALMAPIPAVTEMPTGTVAFLISRTYFDRLAEKYFGDIDPDIFILDAALNVVFDGDGMTSREELTDIVRGKPLGVSDISLESGNRVLMRSVSTAHGLYFVVLADEDAFYDGSGSDGLILAGVGLVYLLCVFLAFTISKHTGNEAAWIERRCAENESRLEKGREQIRELVTLRLLSGAEREGVGRLKTVLNNWDSAFPYRCFCVIVISPASPAALEETRTAVSAGFEKAAGTGRAIYTAIDQKRKKAAVIINTQDPDLDRRALVSSARTELREDLRGRFSAGVGGVYEGELNISVSYLEALTAEDTRENPIFDEWYLFCANGKTQSEPLPYADFALVEQSIRSGSADLSTSVVRKAFEKIDRLTSKSVRCCLYYDMVNMMIKICENVGAPMSTEQISRITAMRDPDIIRRDVTYAALSLTEYVRAQMDAADPSPIKRSLVEYVQNNFMDSNLSLSRLAEEFDLSYAYVSKTFKNDTGRSFQAYLTQLRIDYVKDRLINTGTPIKDIVLQSGYLDVANFTRKFKQIEGVTPGQFRQLHNK